MQNFLPTQDETPRGNPIEVRRPSFHSLLSVAAVVVLAAVSAAWVGYDRYETSHSLVTSESVSVSEQSSPAVSEATGAVKKVFVKPGDTVKAGEVVALVSDPELEMAVQKAQQDLADAQKQSVATQAAVMPPTIVGKAVGAVIQPLPKILKLPKLPLLKGPVKATAVPVPMEMLETQAKKDNASGLVRQLSSTVQLATGKVSAAKTDLAAASQESDAAKAPVEELQTNLDLAKTKRDKYQSLYTQGIISRVEFQNTQADVDAAQTALDEANKQVTDTAATVQQRTADLANDQKLLAGLQVQLTDAQKAYAGIKTPALAPAPVTVTTPVAEAPVVEAPIKLRPPLHLTPPPGLVPLGVAFSPTAHVAAQDQVAKLTKVLDDAAAALKNAEEIRATTDGVVGAVALNAGQMVNRGDTILTISRPETAQALVTLPHSDALKVKKGEMCQFELAANPQAKYSGIVVGFKSPEQVEVKIMGNPQGLSARTALTASIDTRSG